MPTKIASHWTDTDRLLFLEYEAVANAALESCTEQYLAGLLDGEGCVAWKLSRRHSDRGSELVTVTNTHLPTLRFIQNGFGGRIRYGHSTIKTVYDLVWTGREAERLLRRLLPHLVQKRAQAKLVLAGSANKRLGYPPAHFAMLHESLSKLKQVDYPHLTQPGHRLILSAAHRRRRKLYRGAPLSIR